MINIYQTLFSSFYIDKKHIHTYNTIIRVFEGFWLNGVKIDLDTLRIGPILRIWEIVIFKPSDRFVHSSTWYHEPCCITQNTVLYKRVDDSASRSRAPLKSKTCVFYWTKTKSLDDYIFYGTEQTQELHNIKINFYCFIKELNK